MLELIRKLKLAIDEQVVNIVKLRKLMERYFGGGNDT